MSEERQLSKKMESIIRSDDEETSDSRYNISNGENKDKSDRSSSEEASSSRYNISNDGNKDESDISSSSESRYNISNDGNKDESDIGISESRYNIINDNNKDEIDIRISESDIGISESKYNISESKYNISESRYNISNDGNKDEIDIGISEETSTEKTSRYNISNDESDIRSSNESRNNISNDESDIRSSSESRNNISNDESDISSSSESIYNISNDGSSINKTLITKDKIKLKKKGDFNVFEYINRKFKDSNLLEINNTLHIMSKSISKIKKEENDLIKDDFTIFFKYFDIIESLEKDIKNKNVKDELVNNIKENVEVILNEFFDMTLKIKEDIRIEEYDRRRKLYSEKFQKIIGLKEKLENKFNDSERFVKIYSDAMKEYEGMHGSKYLSKHIDEAKPVVKKYLDNLYDIIINGRLEFEDICQNFEYYFKITGESGDLKIMNTFLVSFKETLNKRLDSQIENINYMFLIFQKFCKHVKEKKILNEGIESFFHFFEEMKKKRGFCCFKIVISRFEQHLVYETHLNEDGIKKYNECFLNLKINGFKWMINNKELKDVKEIYDDYINTIKLKEIHLIRKIIFDYLIDYINAKNSIGHGLSENEIKEIKEFRPFLGNKESLLNKKLTQSLNNYKNRIVSAISAALKGFLQTDKDVKTLMEIIKIIEYLPEIYKDILLEAKDAIIKRPIVAYYIYRLIDSEPPNLTNNEYQKAKEIKYQFGFLNNL